MQRHASIKDIARLARVSVSTVSRTLNNHPDVGPVSRQRVAKAIELLKYRPNSRARQLARKTAETICLVLSNREVINAFHARILMGVERCAKEQGRNLIFVRFDYSSDIGSADLVLPSVILERGAIDGLILAGTNYPNFIECLRDLGVPFVIFSNNLVSSRSLDSLNSVGFDSRGGTRQATDYLISLQHRNIWCVADIAMPWYARCYEGYAQAMASAGLEAHRVVLPQQASPFEYGKACARWLVGEKVGATAVVAGDDEIALGILNVMQEKGFRVPDDISVVGFDDLDELKYAYPGLTTVRVNREEVGEKLATLLFDYLTTPKMPPVQRILPTQLVIRDSCAHPRAAATLAGR